MSSVTLITRKVTGAQELKWFDQQPWHRNRKARIKPQIWSQSPQSSLLCDSAMFLWIVLIALILIDYIADIYHYTKSGDFHNYEFDFLFFFLCSLPYTSKLVKTLLYNFIRQEKPPPPGAHVLPQQSDGGGLLYGLASGVASKSNQILSVLWCR